MNKTCHFASIERHHQFGVATYIIIHNNLYHHFFPSSLYILILLEAAEPPTSKKNKKKTNKQNKMHITSSSSRRTVIFQPGMRGAGLSSVLPWQAQNEVAFCFWNDIASRPADTEMELLGKQTKNVKTINNQVLGMFLCPFLCCPPPKSFPQVTK